MQSASSAGDPTTAGRLSKVVAEAPETRYTRSSDGSNLAYQMSGTGHSNWSSCPPLFRSISYPTIQGFSVFSERENDHAAPGGRYLPASTGMAARQ